jgi:Flp pilus assembly protein TadD
MKQILRLALILLIVTCCHEGEKKEQQKENRTHQPDSNAVKLNNKAVKLIGQVRPHNDSLNGVFYDSALTYLNQSIEVDSLYLTAYTNKAQVLLRKNLLEKAIEVLSKVQSIKPDFAEVIMGQGFILEKMGNIELADSKYRQALGAYEKRLNDNPGSAKVQSDIALLYIFLEDRNRAMDEIQNLILENPNNQELKAMQDYIKDFDRKKFIAEY